VYQFPIYKARLLNGGAELSLVQTFSHPSSRQKSQQLSSDKKGSFQANAASGHGTFVETSDPKEYEAERFAKEIADALEEGRINKDYHELILVATPHFHGLLNKELNHNVTKLVSKNIEKDYTKDNDRELLAHLESFL